METRFFELYRSSEYLQLIAEGAFLSAGLTLAAGFIGFHVIEDLLKNKNNRIIGIDNINNYYDRNLKLNRIKYLKKKDLKSKFKFRYILSSFWKNLSLSIS